MNRLVVALSLLMFVGCDFQTRRVLEDGAVDRVLRVRSGDRLAFAMEENATTGYLWQWLCDDGDVEVSVRHVAGDAAGGLVGAPGKAQVEIRVHRGFDGPATVRFRYRRSWEKGAAKEFTVLLYRETGDRAFWR